MTDQLVYNKPIDYGFPQMQPFCEREAWLLGWDVFSPKNVGASLVKELQKRLHLIVPPAGSLQSIMEYDKNGTERDNEEGLAFE